MSAGGAKPDRRSRSRPSRLIRSEVHGTSKLILTSTDRPNDRRRSLTADRMSSIAGQPTKRAFSAFVKAFERGALIRTTGDIIALSPPLIITKGQINELVDHVREVLRSID